MEVYVLFHPSDGSCRGVYSSLDSLKSGVDYWMGLYPDENLSFEEWDVNYPNSGNCWDFCYISPNSDMSSLSQNGSVLVPNQSYWGKNLVNVNWVSHDSHSDVFCTSG